MITISENALRISICDLNPSFVAEAHHHLMGLPNVIEVAHRSVIDHPADAVVSPANSFGFMDGGIDWTYLQFFGTELQTRVQMIIRLQKFQELLVGSAVVVPTYNDGLKSGFRFFWLRNVVTMVGLLSLKKASD